MSDFFQVPWQLFSVLHPTLHLDTSVLGGHFDDECKEPTRELWRQMEAGQRCFQGSAITLDELTDAPGSVRELLGDTFDAHGKQD